MLDTFKARLKAKSTASGSNLSQTRIDAIADRLQKKFPDLTEEADHDLKIDDLYEPSDFKEFASLDDYQRSKAAKDKKDKDDKTKQTTIVIDPQKDDEPPAWARALQDKIDKLEAEKAQSQISQKVFSHDKIKAIPKSFMEGRNLPEKDEDIDSYAENLSKQWTETKQAISDASFQAGNKPAVSSTQQTAGTDKVSSEMTSYLEKKNPKTS